MVRNYKKKTEQGMWSKDGMKKAIEDVKNKKLSYREAAKQHKVPKSTLERHVKEKVAQPGTPKLGRYRSALSSEFEIELVQHQRICR